jgi:preprotein translocase subunit SecF
MEFFKLNTHIKFLQARKLAMVLSLVLVIASITSLAMRGMNWGLDFTGGTVVELKYPEPITINEIRSLLDRNGFADAVIQHFGSTRDIMVRLTPRADMSEQQVGAQLLQILQGDTPDVELLRVDVVGAQIGQEMAEKGGLAILVALIGTMIYIAIRFEWKFAVGAAVALAHDPIIILGIFSFFQFEFDLAALAAILAVIGYSLNDTIVVFDRVRENFKKLRKGDTIEIMNTSLNQTLSRTLMTSFLTLLVVVSLLIYGGTTLFGFSLALFIGVIVGTYSSIYVASPIALALGLKRTDLIPNTKDNPIDDLP